MDKISTRLAIKGFVDRAPKDIVDQEKTNYNNLKNDVERISITIKGISWQDLTKKNYQADILH